VFTPRQWPIAHQRLFAAWLRRHSDDRDAYAQLKQGLYDRGVWGAVTRSPRRRSSKTSWTEPGQQKDWPLSRSGTM
jgi:GrpB-like predicted nucleotidyltransferase (UPF0157 family)